MNLGKRNQRLALIWPNEVCHNFMRAFSVIPLLSLGVLIHDTKLLLMCSSLNSLNEYTALWWLYFAQETAIQTDTELTDFHLFHRIVYFISLFTYYEQSISKVCCMSPKITVKNFYGFFKKLMPCIYDLSSAIVVWQAKISFYLL